MKLSIATDHVLNEKSLAFLQGRHDDRRPFALPGEVKDLYMEQGSHPDIVERLWDQIGKALSAGWDNREPEWILNNYKSLSGKA